MTITFQSEEYNDAIEFESRVNKKLSENMCGNCEVFNVYPICPLTVRKKCNISECRIKHARLSVENEMVSEGKGPGVKKKSIYLYGEDTYGECDVFCLCEAIPKKICDIFKENKFIYWTNMNVWVRPFDDKRHDVVRLMKNILDKLG